MNVRLSVTVPLLFVRHWNWNWMRAYYREAVAACATLHGINRSTSAIL